MNVKEYMEQRGEVYAGDMCETCGKALWVRDADFSKAHFKKLLCREHAPKPKYSYNK